MRSNRTYRSTSDALLQAVAIVTLSVVLDVTIILGGLHHFRIFKDPCPEGRKSKPLDPPDYNTNACRLRVCYYYSPSSSSSSSSSISSRAQGIEDARFVPEMLNTSLCSHIHFAYGQISAESNSLVPALAHDVNCTHPDQGIYFRINKLKQQNPKLKTLISVGGRALRSSSAPFHQMVSTSEGRGQFARSAVHFLLDLGFDGLDLSLEHLAYRGGGQSLYDVEEERRSVTLLIQELRETFDNYSALSRPIDSPWLLTAALAQADEETVKNAYQMDQIHGLLDYISIITPDLQGPWDNEADHNDHKSPQHSLDNRGMHWAAEHYSSKFGVPRYKLLLGILTYGRSFSPTNASLADLGTPPNADTDAEAEGNSTDNSIVAYYQICQKNSQPNRSSEEDGQPYLLDNGQWIVYENVDSISKKARYIMNNGYGGVAVWSPSMDDFSGQSCGQGSFPLMSAINNVICPKWTHVNPVGNHTGGVGLQPFNCSQTD